MKKTIKFSKLFGVMVVVSCALVISGIVGLFTKGINFGIDFQAGFIEKVRFAPSAFILTYSGEKNIQVAQNSQGIDITVISVDTENKVISFKESSLDSTILFTSNFLRRLTTPVSHTVI